MKQIPVTKGQVALVDDEDYEALKIYRWSAQATVNKDRFFVTRKESYWLDDGTRKQRTVYMHRQIMGNPPKETWVIHRDRNGLNNIRRNLILSNIGDTREQEGRLERNCVPTILPGIYWVNGAGTTHGATGYFVKSRQDSAGGMMFGGRKAIDAVRLYVHENPDYLVDRTKDPIYLLLYNTPDRGESVFNKVDAEFANNPYLFVPSVDPKKENGDALPPPDGELGPAGTGKNYPTPPLAFALLPGMPHAIVTDRDSQYFGDEVYPCGCPCSKHARDMHEQYIESRSQVPLVEGGETVYEEDSVPDLPPDEDDILAKQIMEDANRSDLLDELL